MQHEYDNIPDNQKLVIWVDEKNRVRLFGPINDKLTCYALLEVAKDLVRDFKQTAITAPTNGEAEKILGSKPTKDY